MLGRALARGRAESQSLRLIQNLGLLTWLTALSFTLLLKLSLSLSLTHTHTHTHTHTKTHTNGSSYSPAGLHAYPQNEATPRFLPNGGLPCSHIKITARTCCFP